MKDGSGKAENEETAAGKKKTAAEKKKRTFPREKILAMSLVLLFIAAGMFYYFQHIQSNRDHLTRHNVRHLGTIAEVIGERINAFEAAAKNLQYMHVETLTAEIVEEIFSFRTQVNITHPSSADEADSTRTNPPQSKGKGLRLRATLAEQHDSDGTEWSASVEALPPNEVKKGDDAGSALNMSQSAVHFQMFFPQWQITVKVTAQMDDLFDVQEMTEGAFDALFIMNSGGSELLFNSAVDRFRLTSLDSVMLDGVKQSFRDAARNSNVAVCFIAGKSYQLYMQPMGEKRVCALIDTDRFENMARAVQGNVFMDAILILLLMLLAVPLITLHFADYGERIRPHNVLVNIGCIIVGAAVVTLLMAELLYGSFDGENTDNRMLRELSVRIADRAQEEFEAVDRMRYNVGQSVTLGQRDNRRTRLFAGSTDALTDCAFLSYPYFEQLYWLDNRGYMMGHWTTGDKSYDSVPLADRPYFTQVIRGNPRWIFPHYTRATGDFMVAYSRKSAVGFHFPVSDPRKGMNSSVGAVDFLPRSLVHPWFPEGYGYMIIDRSGDVRFHSVLRRALHENLILETGDPALRELIDSGIPGYITARYWDDAIRMYIRPLSLNDAQQWYLVVYSEQDLLSDMRSGTMMATGMLFLAFFLPVFMGFSTYTLAWDRHLSLLWFREREGPWYRIVTIAGGFVVLCCLVYALHTEDIIVSLLIGMIVPQIAYQCILLSLDMRVHGPFGQAGMTALARLRRGSPFIVHLVVLSLLAVFLVNHTPLDRLDESADMIPWTLLLLLPAVLGAAVLAVRMLRRQTQNNAAEERTPPLFSRMSRYFASGLAQHCDRDCARRWYRSLLTTVVALVAIVPVIIFYRVSHDLHGYAYDRVQRVSFHKNADERTKRIESRFMNRSLSCALPGDGENAQSRGTVLLRLDSTALADSIDLYLLPADSASIQDLYVRDCKPILGDTLLRAILPPVNSNTAQFRRLLSTTLPAQLGADPASSDAAVQYDTLRTLHPLTASRLALPRTFSPIPEFWGIVPVILGLAVLLGALFAVILYGTKRIFFADLPATSSVSGPRDDSSRLLLWTTAAEHEKILRSYAGSEGTEIIRCTVETALDGLLQWRPVGEESDARIVLDAFEHRCFDAEMNRRKLAVLEYLCYTLCVRVSIVCSVDPMYYFFHEDDAEQDARMRDRWTRVLSMFLREATVVKNHSATYEAPCGPPDNRTKMHAIAAQECVLPALRSVYTRLTGAINAERFACSSDVYHWLERECKPVYQSLWMTCTRRERLMLYRIAHDGFAPYRAAREIVSLCERGLLVMQPALCVFNESFRRFVAAAKSVEQIRAWESREAVGLWSNIKHPLIIGFVLIAAALFYANPAYFDSTVAILTAMAGAIPLLLRVRGYLTGGKSE